METQAVNRNIQPSEIRIFDYINQNMNSDQSSSMIEDLNNVPSSNKKATRNQIKSCYQDM